MGGAMIDAAKRSQVGLYGKNNEGVFHLGQGMVDR
jgi:hypothetical protein